MPGHRNVPSVRGVKFACQRRLAETSDPKRIRGSGLLRGESCSQIGSPDCPSGCIASSLLATLDWFSWVAQETRFERTFLCPRRPLPDNITCGEFAFLLPALPGLPNPLSLALLARHRSRPSTYRSRPQAVRVPLPALGSAVAAQRRQEVKSQALKCSDREN